MNDKSTGQIVQNLIKQVPSDKSYFLVVVDKETQEASVFANMSEAYLVSTLIQIYKSISPLGRDCAKIAIKNMDCKTDSQESESLKINLN